MTQKLPSKKAIRSAATVFLISALVISYIINVYFVLSTLGYLFDFGSFIAAGQLANAGQNPYANDSPLILSVKFTGNGQSGVAPNLNPPISVLIFQRIATIPPSTSITIWRIATILFYSGGLFALQRTHPVRISQSLFRLFWAISLAGFWHAIQLGQIYTLAFLFTIGAWLFFNQNRPIVGGMLLGVLIAIKPNFVFWAVLLGIAGNWRAFLSAGLTAAGISLIPLMTNGIKIYVQWLEATSIFTPDLLLFPGNSSFQSLMARFGSPETGIAMGALLVCYVAWHVFKTRPTMTKINALGIIVSLLISPIAWTGYTLLALPIFFENQKWSWKLYLAAILFAVPFVFPLQLFQTSFINFIVFGWFYGWGLLALLYDELFTASIRVDQKAAMTSSIQTN